MKPVAILGSGPAGLLSAWALTAVGRPCVILSDGGKSRLGGAQFLHGPIPGLGLASEPEAVVNYVRRGDPEVYKNKAFGSTLVPWQPWSDGAQPPERDAWSMSAMYDVLWEAFGPSVISNTTKVTPEWIDDNSDKFAAVISSIPLDRLCRRQKVSPWDSDLAVHRFTTQDILVHTEAFEEMPDNTVIYDGTRDKSWYRTSRIFGQGGTEWNLKGKHPRGLSPMFQDRKPIWTNCDCMRLPGVLCVGRRGRWSVEELAHNAFYDTMYMIGALYGR